MVKQAIKRLVLRYFPELGQRKHLVQLARIENIYDLPTTQSELSTAFRPFKAADIVLICPHTNKPLDVPIFEQVTLATGQASNAGLINEPTPGMHCLIQYIDGLNSHPVITSLLPWHGLVPTHKHTDVSLKQNERSQLQGRDGHWHLQTDGAIRQSSDTNLEIARSKTAQYHERTCSIDTHDITKIDGNQINEIMGALKTIVGEKALIVALEGLLLGSQKQVDIKAHDNMNLETLKTLHAKAAELAKVQGQTVWLGNESVNAVQILLELINVVSSTNQTLATHSHPPGKPPSQAAQFTGYKGQADGLKSQLQPIVG